MTRAFYIERVLRQVYGDYLRDDSTITDNLVNSYLNDGIALAAKQCYKEAAQLEGVGYVNNSFYLTFKGIEVETDEQGIYKVELPQIPIAIGKNEGISSLQFKNDHGRLSHTVIFISENQRSVYEGMRPIPNKLLAWTQGKYAFIKSTIPLFQYTASVSLVSGGDSTNLDSELNLPDDYMPVVNDYVVKMLMLERNQITDKTNDGADTK